MWEPLKINEQIRITEFYTMFEINYTDGYEFPGETHNFWECVYVEKGEICVTSDERIYNLKENQIIFHKPLELHKFYSEATGESGSLFIFSFSAEGSICSFFREKVFTLSETQKEIIFSLIKFARNSCHTSGEYDEKMYLKSQNDSPLYPLSLASYTTLLFLSLYENNNTSFALTSPDAALFSSAVSYMNKNIEQALTVDGIAKSLNIGQTSLKRLFRKYSGHAVHKYFLKLKMNAATQMLQGGMSVTETAEKLGFASQGYFSAAYKRETGISPSGLRLTVSDNQKNNTNLS